MPTHSTQDAWALTQLLHFLFFRGRTLRPWFAGLMRAGLTGECSPAHQLIPSGVGHGAHTDGNTAMWAAVDIDLWVRMSGGQQWAVWNFFSPPTTWVLRIDLRSLGLVAGAFTC